MTGSGGVRLVPAVLAAAASLAALATLAVLGAGVVRELRLLDSARSDNVQWTLAQAEVEFLDLRAAVAIAAAGPPPPPAAALEAVRREFDIFYSRIGIVSGSDVYRALRLDPRHAAALAEAEAFLAHAVPLIDAPDAALAAALPRLAAMTEAARPAVRALSVTGLESFAAQADARREAVAGTLLRLALVTAALVTVLAVAAFVLARLYRVARARAGALELATERLRTVFSTSLDAIVVADARGRILEFNAAAERIFGYERFAVIGRTLDDTIVPRVHRAAHLRGMERHRRTGETRVIGRGRMRLEARRRTGEVFPVELSIQSARGADGEIFVSFLRDISHRVAAERELVAARDQAVAGERAKAEFLAVMSHEIRTPLNGLLGTLSLMRDTWLDARQSELVANMEASGALLQHHVDDVLDISKYEAGKLAVTPGPVDPGALVAAIVDAQRDVARAGGTEIGWGWEGAALGLVETDAARLRQILVNLVGNATKFTTGGRVHVALSAEPAKGEGQGAGPGAGQGAGSGAGAESRAILAIAVSDTGIGIAEEAQARIFEDFETVDPSYGRAAGGTGLGLGIARRMTEALGGEITLRSAPGAGSTFCLRLPVRVLGPAAEAPRTGAAAAERVLPAAGEAPKRVLVVEDNAINRSVLEGMLAADGHTVVSAEDGPAGVARAGAAPFDLILMDIGLPGMDGREAARRIRASGGPSAAAPVVAVTAHALPEEVRALERDGFAEVLRKPVDRVALRRLLAAGPADGPAAAPAAGPGRAAPVDTDRLAEMRADLGPETALRLLDRFLAEGDAAVARLARPGRADRPPAETAREAHHLASAAAIFGATALHGALNEIEMAAGSEGDRDHLDALCRDLPPLWARTRQALRAGAGEAKAGARS